MKHLVANSSLALALLVSSLFWLPTLLAQGSQGYWETSEAGADCSFLKDVERTNHTYLCADWFTDEGIQETCCITEWDFTNSGLEACRPVVVTPSTDERPNL